MIPAEIPEPLRSAALDPPEAGELEAAWTPDDALAVLDALEGTFVAVVRGQAYQRAPLGAKMRESGDALIPIDGSWELPPMQGETESSRARRSRAEAAVFVRAQRYLGVDFVSLEFSYQDEAA